MTDTHDAEYLAFMRILAAYWRGFKDHYKPSAYAGLVAAAAVTLVSLLVDAPLLKLTVPVSWLLPIVSWGIAIAIAQYSVWQEQWKKTAGTAEDPYTSRGLRVVTSKGLERLEDSEDPDAKASFERSSYATIESDKDLRNKALKVVFDGDFDLVSVWACHVAEGSNRDIPFVVGTIKPLAAKSILLDLRGYRAYPNHQIKRIKIQVIEESTPRVVHVEVMG